MKGNIEEVNKWLYHRIRMGIWKLPKTKIRNLMKLGVAEELADQVGNTRRRYRFTTHSVAVNMT